MIGKKLTFPERALTYEADALPDVGTLPVSLRPLLSCVRQSCPSFQPLRLLARVFSLEGEPAQVLESER